jgi:hypothetical protein
MVMPQDAEEENNNIDDIRALFSDDDDVDVPMTSN